MNYIGLGLNDKTMGSDVRCARPYEEAWAHYVKRFDPKKYEKFTECFVDMTAKTNVRDAKSMITVGLGKNPFHNSYAIVKNIEF